MWELKSPLRVLIKAGPHLYAGGENFIAAIAIPNEGEEPRVDWHLFDKKKFAQELATSVNAAALKGSFDKLVLVAPPKTLGDLRGGLNQQAAEKVSAEIPKDYTHVTPKELQDHLSNLIVL